MADGDLVQTNQSQPKQCLLRLYMSSGGKKLFVHMQNSFSVFKAVSYQSLFLNWFSIQGRLNRRVVTTPQLKSIFPLSKNLLTLNRPGMSLPFANMSRLNKGSAGDPAGLRLMYFTETQFYVSAIKTRACIWTTELKVTSRAVSLYDTCCWQKIFVCCCCRLLLCKINCEDRCCN